MVPVTTGLLTSTIALQPAVLGEHEPLHEVVFENRWVKVIDAAVAVGQATAYHTHERSTWWSAVIGWRGGWRLPSRLSPAPPRGARRGACRRS